MDCLRLDRPEWTGIIGVRLINFAREPLAACWHEIYDQPDGLAYQHWCETQQYRHDQPYNPLFERYDQYARAGWFLQFTVRDNGKLVGYSGVYMVPSMHSQMLICVEDTWFLLPEYRKGWNAARFYKWIEEYCTALGAVEATLTIPNTKDERLGHMLQRLDYRPISVQYSKRLQQHQHRADSAQTGNPINAVEGKAHVHPITTAPTRL